MMFAIQAVASGETHAAIEGIEGPRIVRRAKVQEQQTEGRGEHQRGHGVHARDCRQFFRAIGVSKPDGQN